MHKNWLIQKIQKWRSSFRRADLSFVPSPDQSHQQPGPSSSPNKIANNCTDANMDQFIKCICENDLNALVISGTPSPEEIAEAWTNIFYEYCDLVEATEAKYRSRLFSEIQILTKKLELAQGWLKILEIQFFPELVIALQKIGFEYEFNPNDKHQFADDIASLKSEIFPLNLQLKVKKEEYRYLMKNQSTSENISKEFFLKLIFNINRYTKANPPISLNSSILDYCIALKAYADEFSNQKTNK